ncbi:GAF and ANTAR domain-containing protein [Actinophytocola oryzae]|uniref:GAF domain-containing protein n=1 Tax=Actinophytocola oryzae TaxID=502181 RepID=A0A4R7VQ84_9PSEU|nr:GAF and ANTAR domain-containing protein [Actinophytocola oryzae]TDV51900.1 GAF domain-containing protein [Actinophytocola oryzae]
MAAVPRHVLTPDDANPAARFLSLTHALLGTTSVTQTLARVVTFARDAVSSADAVSVTLRGRDGECHTTVETDWPAAELDGLQYSLGEGGCVEATRPDGPATVVSVDLAAEPRWRRFGPAAARRGFHSLLSTALPSDAEPPCPSGALNVYSRRPDAFTHHDRDTLLLVATHASLALARTEAVARSEQEVRQLRRAVASRDVIGQAKGILMVRRHLTADEAFDVLCRTSQDLNVKVRDLAETVAREGAPTAPGDPGQCGDLPAFMRP